MIIEFRLNRLSGSGRRRVSKLAISRYFAISLYFRRQAMKTW